MKIVTENFAYESGRRYDWDRGMISPCLLGGCLQSRATARTTEESKCCHETALTMLMKIVNGQVQQEEKAWVSGCTCKSLPAVSDSLASTTYT